MAELVNLDSPAGQLPKNAGEASTARKDNFRLCKGPIPTTDLRRFLLVNVQKFAPVYRYTDGLIMGETVLVEVMKKFKDAGITDYGLVWNTDLIETLELENYVNPAEYEMFSAVILSESVPGSSETAKSSAGVDVIEEPALLLPAVYFNIGGIPTSW